MMTDRLYIDGEDAFSNYGVFLSNGSLNELMSIPAFKNLSVNDWQEEDGEEVDLSNPVLPSRTVTMTFNIEIERKARNLLADLADGAYHTFRLPSLRREWKLRLISMPNFKAVAGIGLFSLRFADDFPPVVVPSGLTAVQVKAWKAGFDPVTLFLAESPSADNLVKASGMTIDNIDLARFGIYLLRGVYDSMAKAPEVKTALSRNSKQIPGAEYDSKAEVVYKAKDVTLNLFMRPATITDFWNQWRAFLTLLLKPGERNVYYDKTHTTNIAYFKGARITRIDPYASCGPWCEFQLILRLMDPRP